MISQSVISPNTLLTTVSLHVLLSTHCHSLEKLHIPSFTASMEILSQESSTLEKATNRSTETLPAEAQWRLFKSLEILHTLVLNRQLQRRWSLEQQCMQQLPVKHRIRLIMFLEPVPPVTRWSGRDGDLQRLKARVKHLKARIEKGKELAAEIERRMKTKRITCPPNFCHTCLSTKEVLHTRCGHKVCLTCVSCSIDKDGGYECSICFAPTSFVRRCPLIR